MEKIKTPETITKLKFSTNLTVNAMNADGNLKFKASDILLARSEINPGFSYYSLDNLDNTKNILMEVDGKLVDFPQNMTKKLEYYFKEQNNIQESFDCGSFAHLLNSIDYDWPHFKSEKFNIEQMDNEMLNKLQTGDTVFISKFNNPENYGITHFAIYLSDGLYISKFGNSGKLIVTNMENMKKGFGGKYMFKSTPRNI